MISGKPPVAYAYDLRTAKETMLRKDALGALWISPTELLVTNAKGPGKNSLNSWEIVGSGTRITVGGGRKTVSIRSTLWDADVLFDD